MHRPVFNGRFPIARGHIIPLPTNTGYAIEQHYLIVMPNVTVHSSAFHHPKLYARGAGHSFTIYNYITVEGCQEKIYI